jgi:alkylation response protein AidB-like acyl-CoA dehydrogenase
MARTDSLLVDVTRKLLRDVADPQTRRLAGAADRRATAWRALETQGLTRAWLPEAAGGAGAELVEGFEIVTLAGQFALDAPLAETLLAGWLLAAAGLEVPAGALAPASGSVELGATGRLSGRLARVAFAREVDHLVVAGDRFVARIDRAACRIEPRDNLAGEPRDTVILDGVPPAARAELPGAGDRLLAMGAVARACQIAGALQAVLARSVAHAEQRVAFDRPIGKFQAIQQALARLAGETAIALAASSSAADALGTPGDDPDGVFLEVASAKIRAGEAAAAGAAIAHQVHGAIGFSTEHPLHLFTRRLWAWRDDFGSEAAWAVRLGSRVAARGADALWPLLASR